METPEMIPLTNQFEAVAPDTGKSIKVVGVDMSSGYGPKLICLVTDINGTRVETYDHAKNKRH